MTQPPPGAAPRVLFVDDEEDNLTTARRVFRNDFRVRLATSGDKALAELATHEFDVVLVDYAMPEMDGIALLRAIRALGKDTPCIMVTAHAELEVVREALRAGLCRAIVSKPWQAEELRRWVFQIHRMQTLRATIGAMRKSTE